MGPGGIAELALLEGLLQRALADDLALTQHPSAPGARFRLLALALQHAGRLRVRPCLAVVPLRRWCVGGARLFVGFFRCMFATTHSMRLKLRSPTPWIGTFSTAGLMVGRVTLVLLDIFAVSASADKCSVCVNRPWAHRAARLSEQRCCTSAS